MAWSEKIDLNRLLTKLDEEYDLERVEENCPQAVKEAIVAEIRKSTWLASYAEDVLACKSIAAVNRCLQKIYDVADIRRVWCGMP